jgi:hypothetical protein
MAPWILRGRPCRFLNRNEANVCANRCASGVTSIQRSLGRNCPSLGITEAQLGQKSSQYGQHHDTRAIQDWLGHPPSRTLPATRN